MNFPGYPVGTVRPLMNPEGDGSSGIMMLGEAPGEHEERDGLPFRPHAEAGSVLERALFRAGISRKTLTLSNLVWYRPPRNWLDGAPWEAEAIEACRGLNDALIEQRRPRVILALGGLAMRELTGLSGEKRGIGMTRGFIVPARAAWTATLFDDAFDDTWATGQEISTPTSCAGIPIVGTYHPSFLKRGSKERTQESEGPRGKTQAIGGGTAGGMSLLGVLIRDILLAQTIAQKGAPQFKYHNYVQGGTLEDWRRALEFLRSRPDLIISYDFETQDSLMAETEEDQGDRDPRVIREVTQVQISWEVGQALVSAWSPELKEVLKAILELPNPKLDWNGRKFDRPILREMGIRTDQGVFHDGMDFWHHFQPDLPRNLQFATSFVCPEVGPWKHMSHQSPFWYGALDVDMPQRIWREISLGMKTTVEFLSGQSLWGDGKYSGYTGQVAALAPVLDEMSALGIPVDEEQRQALDVEFTATLVQQMTDLQGLVPAEVKGIHVYKKTPKPEPTEGAKTVIKIGAGQRSREVVTEWTQSLETVQVKCGCWWSKNKKQQEKALFIGNCEACYNTGKITTTRHLWAKVEPFLPGSPQQVMAYLKHQNYEIPRNYKTNAETTGEVELERLGRKTKDPVIPLILSYREISKLRGTYVEGWKPGPDGRVHSTFGFKPATGQLSSENPNAQNFPAHGNLAKQMKRMLAAPDGKVMVNFDYKSFHVLTLGFEAQDPDYMRMARLDMHTFFALTGLMKIESADKLLALPDDELKAVFKRYRSDPKLYAAYGGRTFQEIRDEKAKKAILGVGFGQRERSLYMLNQDSYTNTAETKQVLDALDGTFNRPAGWRLEVQNKADREKRLVSRHGYVRWFWDVATRKPVGPDYQPRGRDKVYQGRDGQRWLLKPGDDAEACIAFLPANDAFGTIRRVMVQLREHGLAQKYGLCNQVHDSLVFCVDKPLLDDCLWNVRTLMASPNPYLSDPKLAPQGLSVDVEAKFGPSLAEMEEYKFK